jgi:hypothetical protein
MWDCEDKMALPIDAAEAELKKLEAERQAQYWNFTRRANAKPVEASLMRRICELEEIIHSYRFNITCG